MEDEEEAGGGVEVPPYFLCPISLQLMHDPVTLPTGITYDRDSIEEWLSSTTTTRRRADMVPICPVTKQKLSYPLHLTPNTTLRRLIQTWRSSNAHQLPTVPDASLLLREAPTSLPSLRRLRDFATDSCSARRSLLRSDATGVLLGILRDSSASPTLREESLAVLHFLRLPDDSLRELVDTHLDFVGLLTAAMRDFGPQGRAHAVALLHATLHAAGVGPGPLEVEVLADVARVVRDGVSTKTALQLLREVMQVGRNRVRAAEAGVVEALLELLLNRPERRSVEMALAALELLCRCAEGRLMLTSHPAGLAVVAQAVMTVSDAASERAVRVLWWVSRHASEKVVQEMALVGAVSKLCDCSQAEWSEGRRVAAKAREALKMHAGAWRSKPSSRASQKLLLSLALIEST